MLIWQQDKTGTSRPSSAHLAARQDWNKQCSSGSKTRLELADQAVLIWQQDKTGTSSAHLAARQDWNQQCSSGSKTRLELADLAVLIWQQDKTGTSSAHLAARQDWNQQCSSGSKTRLELATFVCQQDSLRSVWLRVALTKHRNNGASDGVGHGQHHPQQTHSRDGQLVQDVQQVHVA